MSIHRDAKRDDRSTLETERDEYREVLERLLRTEPWLPSIPDFGATLKALLAKYDRK